MLGDRSGQALTELLAALVVVMVLVAGLLTISELGMVHTGSMMKARRLAGADALQSNAPFASPDYIAAVTVGADGEAYTRDDQHTGASVPDFQSRLIDYSHPDPLGEQRPGNSFTTMSSEELPYLMFGLVEGAPGATTVSLTTMPVVRQLLYDAESVDIKGKAWLTWMTGIY